MARSSRVYGSSGAVASTGGYNGRLKMQARVGRETNSAEEKYSCSDCRIQYWMKSGYRAVCPLCQANDVVSQLRRKIEEQANENDILRRDNGRLERQVDSFSQMRTAIELLEGEDLAFVKSFLYEWRDDPSRLSVKPGTRREQRRIPNVGAVVREEVRGFEVHRRYMDDPEIRLFESVGGVSLALAFSEAVKVMGQVKAMDLLLRAAAPFIAEGVGNE